MTDGTTVSSRATTARATLPLGDTMVLFDWNGTVVVDADRAMAALNLVLTRRGLPALGEGEFSVRFRLPLGELLGRLGVADKETAEAEREWAEALESCRAHLREGAGDCLAALADAGAWLGVVSASSAAAVRFDQRSLGVPSVWNSVDAGVADKFTVLARHRPVRSEAFYVGDSSDDMRSASAAGYTPVGVATPGAGDAGTAALRSAGAVHVIERLNELPSVLGAGR